MTVGYLVVVVVVVASQGNWICSIIQVVSIQLSDSKFHSI